MKDKRKFAFRLAPVRKTKTKPLSHKDLIELGCTSVGQEMELANLDSQSKSLLLLCRKLREERKLDDRIIEKVNERRESRAETARELAQLVAAADTQPEMLQRVVAAVTREPEGYNLETPVWRYFEATQIEKARELLNELVSKNAERNGNTCLGVGSVAVSDIRPGTGEMAVSAVNGVTSSRVNFAAGRVDTGVPHAPTTGNPSKDSGVACGTGDAAVSTSVSASGAAPISWTGSRPSVTPALLSGFIDHQSLTQPSLAIPQSDHVWHMAEVVRLQSPLSYGRIRKFKDYVDLRRLTGVSCDRNALIDGMARFTVQAVIEAQMQRAGVPVVPWDSLTDAEFFAWLFKAYPQDATSTNILGQIVNLHMGHYHAKSPDVIVEFNSAVRRLVLETYGSRDPPPDMERALVKAVKDRLCNGKGGSDASRGLINALEGEGTVSEATSLDHYLTALYNKALRVEASGREYLAIMKTEEKRKEQPWKKESKDYTKSTSTSKVSGGEEREVKPRDRTVCNGCGRKGHVYKDCQVVKYHPNANKNPKIEWKESSVGKKWAEKNRTQVPLTQDLQGNTVTLPEAVKATLPQRREKTKREGMLEAYVCSNTTAETYLLPACISMGTDQYLLCYYLIDTGCLQANFIAKTCWSKIKDQSMAQTRESEVIVKAVFSDDTRPASGVITLTLRLLENSRRGGGLVLDEVAIVTVISEDFHIIDTDVADIIIGRPTIVKHDLLSLFPLQGPPVTIGACPENTQQSVAIVSSIPKKSLMIEEEDDPYEVQDDDPLELIKASEEYPLEDCVVAEEAGLREALLGLIREYSDIFSADLSDTPADTKAMVVETDLVRWHTPGNRQPPRLYSINKQQEIIRQVKQMLESGVIQKSQASHYSHALLVLKADKVSYRFCVDYRRLNDATKSLGWPIPNIKEMLMRIGRNGWRYFAVMDLTQGYFQTLLHPGSRHLTAFITPIGTFEWIRVPMGLKGAPSFFQQELATTVLGIGDILYTHAENYMDDVLVGGTDSEDLLTGLRKVFEKFRRHHIRLNPKKCRFGTKSTEFVGHELSAVGVSVSVKRRSAVLELPLPTTMGELKRFLGIANYFRDHCKNHSIVVQPLHGLLEGYTKAKRGVVVRWTPELERIFYQVRQAINDCPTLYFLNPEAAVYLHTDASDKGIGAYLFQLVDEKEQPIIFISKSLDKVQRRWDTIEKEAYAIYWALHELEYLVGGIHFVLRTDHKNLTYINAGSSDKVRRWKLGIQEFDFMVEHIPGEDNLIADALSRQPSFEKLSVQDEPQGGAVLRTEADTVVTCMPMEVYERRIPMEVYKVISKHHNSVVGHHGVHRTMAMMQANGHTDIEHLKVWVTKFVKQCPLCQKLSERVHLMNTKPFVTSVSEPMALVAIDTLKVSADKYGNEYIITIIDCFTRFVELYATVKADAQSAARALLMYIGRYGFPYSLLSDNGSQYVNGTIKELTELVGFQHITILPYSSEENGLVERAHKTVLRFLRGIIYHRNVKYDWSDVLPLVQRIVNTTIHSSIGTSPARLLFGNAVNLDRGLFIPGENISLPTKVSLQEWSTKMLNRQAELLQIAAETQTELNERHKRERRRPGENKVEIGDFVLLAYFERQHAPMKRPDKFSYNLRGPLRVVTIAADGNTYELQDLVTLKSMKVHVKFIRPFFYDPAIIDPREVALKDIQAFVIKQIIKHKGSPKAKTKMQFYIHWEGYDDSTHHTWETYDTVKHTEQFHRYCIERQFPQIIPPEITLDDVEDSEVSQP